MDLPGLNGSGTDNEPVPVTGFAENFSPIPRIAPPPLGNEIAGGVAVELVDEPFAEPFAGCAVGAESAVEAVVCGEALV